MGDTGQWDENVKNHFYDQTMTIQCIRIIYNCKAKKKESSYHCFCQTCLKTANFFVVFCLIQNTCMV
jgi:hypothetical protein